MKSGSGHYADSRNIRNQQSQAVLSRLNGDGRSREDDSKQYGTGGTLQGKKYMLSVTFNAPEEAFNNENQFFFEGKSVDDLLFPTHLNFKFFGMKGLPTFACFDVMKNPQIQEDFKRFDTHITKHILES